MSFQNSYSNINVEVSLATANLAATEINVSDLSNVTITGGTLGQVLARGPFETVEWSSSSITPTTAPGANTQVVIRDGNSNSFAATDALTFDTATNTLSVANAINSTATLSITRNANLGNIDNMTIYGGANGEVLVSDGNGNVSWQASPGSSVVTQNYITDNNITVYFDSTGRDVALKVANDKTYAITSGVLISFSGFNGPYYTISTASAPQTIDNNFKAVFTTLSTSPGTFPTAGTVCTVKENIQVNTLITNGGIVDIDVADSFLTLTEDYGFTSPGQILLNNSGNFAVASNVRYYETQAGIATANQQLVATGDINTGRITGVSSNLRVGSHTNNTTASINFANSSSTGYFETVSGGTVNFNANNVLVSGYIQAKTFTNKPVKFAHYTKTVVQGIGRSVYPTDWYNVTWDNVITDTTGLTYSSSTGSWTNNTGSTQRVLVTYQLAWTQGSPEAGMAKTVAIVVNDNIQYGVFGMSSNHNGTTDEPCFSSTFLIELPNGSDLRIKVTQNTDGGTQYIGLAGYNGQSVGGRLTLMILP